MGSPDSGMLSRVPPARAFVLGLLAWIFAIILAVKLGAARDADTDVIARLRVPRALLATAVGAGLSIAGATLQALFTNPLCEPYTLGVSQGAALGAVIGASLGLQWSYGGVAGTAFLGALLFAGALFVMGSRRGSRSARGSLSLLLAGVMLGFLGSSLVALWMALADINGIQGALFWLLGDLSRARISGATLTLGGVLVLGGLIWSRSRELDALLMGEEGALSLGVPVTALRRTLVVWTALLVALCVSGAGMIGFVGLVVPHFIRRTSGALHASLLPLAAIWGAVALTTADTLARVAARPYEIPVGVVTALIGAPLFLWVILGRRATS